ncbi:NUDIX domain-containing protein [Paracoccaceae bacterium]|nr:NUDIX domain-containing protein [Paracoccaceae bacterium]
MRKPIVQKVCPIVSRCSNATGEILMFRHPLAGIKLVKGTFEPAENPANAARRELFEESGLVASAPLSSLVKPSKSTLNRRGMFSDSA